MLITDIKRVIEQVSRDRGIDTDLLVKALEEALKSAARKKFGNKIDIEVKYSEELGEIEVFQFREVVEKISEPVKEHEVLQITIKEAGKLDPECELGDSIGTKMDTGTFGRIAAQSAKQVIIQKMKDAEREAVYSSFIDRKGDTINGIVQRIDRGNIVVNLGQTEGILPDREQVPRESYRRGDRIRAYIMDVRNDTRGPQIILSRTHPNFLASLFRTEVPEISEGIVNVMGAAREPGVRAKFAVASNDSDIDPVGACVGMKGSRVQNVVQELRGEKIDIISWHIDPARFVCNALAPAEISRVIIDEENRNMEVIVPDEFLSVAIGKRGQNVRLASKLTRWRLDVKSESQYSKDMRDGYDSLMSMPGMSISLADALYEMGFFSAEEITKSTVDDLIQVRGMTEEQASDLIETAGNYMADPDSFAEESEAVSEDEQVAEASEMSDAEDSPVSEAPADDEESEAVSEDEQVTEASEVSDAEDSPVSEVPADDEESEAVSEDEQVTESPEASATEDSEGSSAPDIQKADVPENNAEDAGNGGDTSGQVSSSENTATYDM